MDRVRMTTKNCSEVLGSARRCSALLGGARDCSELLESARAVLGGGEPGAATCKCLIRGELLILRRSRKPKKCSSARQCSIYSIGRALPSTFASTPSPMPPPPAPPCGGGAGWRRCDLRERFSKSEPLRGWGALPTRRRIFRARPRRVDGLHKFASGRHRNPAETRCRAEKRLANQAVVGAKNVLLLTRRCGIVATKDV